MELLQYLAPSQYRNTSGMPTLGSKLSNDVTRERSAIYTERKQKMEQRIKDCISFLDEVDKRSNKDKENYVKNNIQHLTDSLILISQLTNQLLNREKDLVQGMEIMRGGFPRHLIMGTIFTLQSLIPQIPGLISWIQSASYSNPTTTEAPSNSTSILEEYGSGTSGQVPWAGDYMRYSGLVMTGTTIVGTISLALSDIYKQWFGGNRKDILKEIVASAPDFDFDKMVIGSNSIYKAMRSYVETIQDSIQEFRSQSLNVEINNIEMEGNARNFLLETIERAENGRLYYDLNQNPRIGFIPRK